MNYKKILVIGGGLAGCTCARMLADTGHTVILREKQKYIGGICRDQRMDTYNCYLHLYGIHCFHTKHKEIWDFIRRFSEFKDFHLQQMSEVNGKLYHFPINFNTIEEVFGKRINTKEDADKLIKDASLPETNFENCAINDVGITLYGMFIKPYTEKQWKMPCNKLPVNIYNRIKIRYNRNNDLFQNQYQGLPKNGYYHLFNKMLSHPNICVETKIEHKNNSLEKWDTVIYTGAFTELPYRCTEFVNQIIETHNKYPLISLPYNKDFTRFTDFFFHSINQNKIIEKHCIIYEKPKENNTDIPLYPIITNKNIKKYDEAKEKYLSKFQNTILIGRLATYKYLNMDDTIMHCYKILSENKLIPYNYFVLYR